MTDGRFSPRAIKGDPDNDRYVLTTMGGRPMWLPGGITGLTSADSSVTVTDNGDGTLDLAAVGGGGGGGTNVKDRRWTIGATETSIDEFDDASIDAAWIHVDATGHSGFARWTEDGDVVAIESGLGTDAVAEMHGLVRPLSGIGGPLASGDGIVTRFDVADFPNTNYVIAGLVVSDNAAHGSGNQLFLTKTNNTTVIDRRIMTGWNTAGAAASMFAATPPWIRLVKLTGNDWRIDASLDGIGWTLGGSGGSTGSTFTWAFTPTHVGIAVSSWGTATKGTVSVECLRRVAGV